MTRTLLLTWVEKSWKERHQSCSEIILAEYPGQEFSQRQDRVSNKAVCVCPLHIYIYVCIYIYIYTHTHTFWHPLCAIYSLHGVPKTKIIVSSYLSQGGTPWSQITPVISNFHFSKDRALVARGPLPFCYHAAFRNQDQKENLLSVLGVAYVWRPRGLTDKASDFGSEDWGFESLRG